MVYEFDPLVLQGGPGYGHRHGRQDRMQAILEPLFNGDYGLAGGFAHGRWDSIDIIIVLNFSIGIAPWLTT